MSPTATLEIDASAGLAGFAVRTVATIAEGVRKKLGGNLPQVDMKAVVADVAVGKKEGAAIKVVTSVAETLWGFVVDRLPGRRYRKLLLRAVVADAEYAAIERALEAVWTGPAYG